jgi:hypothetical protein
VLVLASAGDLTQIQFTRWQVKPLYPARNPASASRSVLVNAEPHRATAAGGSWWPSGRARILLRSTGSGHAGCRVGRFHGTLSLFLQSAVQRQAGASPQGSYHPGSGYFQGRESAQVTRIGADYLACRSILAIVPPCAGECRLVRVTGVLIFENSRTCVALVCAPKQARSTIAAAPVSGPVDLPGVTGELPLLLISPPAVRPLPVPCWE